MVNNASTIYAIIRNADSMERLDTIAEVGDMVYGSEFSVFVDAIAERRAELMADEQRKARIEALEQAEARRLATTGNYFVTYFSECPYYEPAEGGYYYAGQHNVAVREFQYRKDALRFWNKVRKQFFAEDVEDISLVTERGNGSYNRYTKTLFEVRQNSRYIGEGYGIALTQGPLAEWGEQTYC